jgi:uncharacterized protein (DUF1499 family)
MRKVEQLNFKVFTVALVASASLVGCNPASLWQTQAGPSDRFYADGRLAPCPQKPNCVSTQGEDREHSIVPFTYSKPIDEAKLALRELLEKQEGASVIKEDGLYLHVEFRSRVLKFVDDVEFLFDEPSKTLQFRSGSRFGYSDWSVNRKRMENIRNSLLGKI